ncbi:MAG: PP0621 family protein [Burkholderiales bacterium]
MGRLIVLGLAVLALVWLLRRAVEERPDAPRAPKPSANSDGDLVRCAHCGLHLPRAEAREKGGMHYCSEEHARLGTTEGR